MNEKRSNIEALWQIAVSMIPFLGGPKPFLGILGALLGNGEKLRFWRYTNCAKEKLQRTLREKDSAEVQGRVQDI